MTTHIAGEIRPRVVQSVRHEIKRREVEVCRVRELSPHMRAITFRGDALADFQSPGFDDHVKFMLDLGDAEPVKRDYTPRAFDAAARELTIEFLLHGTGPASIWAAQAKAGDRATVGGPKRSFIVPVDFDWHLLVGDESALPAISRRLGELPAGARVIVIAQAREMTDRRKFDTAAALQLTWVDDNEQCLGAVRSLELPSGEGFAWGAGEASTIAALRRVLVEEKGLDRRYVKAAAYWKAGKSAHHENLE